MDQHSWFAVRGGMYVRRRIGVLTPDASPVGDSGWSMMYTYCRDGPHVAMVPPVMIVPSCQAAGPVTASEARRPSHRQLPGLSSVGVHILACDVVS